MGKQSTANCVEVEPGQYVGVIAAGVPFRATVLQTINKFGHIAVLPTDGYIPPCHEAGEPVLVLPDEIVTHLPDEMDWLRGPA